MTREDAIKELECLRNDYWDDDGYGHETEQYENTVCALDMAIKALEQEPKWIPITERLPEKNVWVLVTVAKESGKYVEIMRRDRYKGMFTDNIDYYDSIIAWMPLPEPYKKGEEE